MVDQKVTALTEDTSVLSTDLGYTVEDPGGTPTSKKATWLTILKGQLLGLLTSDGDLVTRTSGAAARLTRADLAADSAFSSVYAPLSSVASDTINSSQNTTSTSFTDLATAGPAVTITVPASGKVVVSLTVETSAGSGTTAGMGVALSGANTVAANFDDAAITSTTTRTTASRTFLLTGLTAGSTTFTCKYAVTGGTGTFNRRTIVVETKP